MDANTFDLSALLSGASLPKDEVIVFADEEAAYELHKVEKALAKDPENEALEARRVELTERGKASKFVFRLTAVPRMDILTELEALSEKYPTRTALGVKASSSFERQEAEFDVLWRLHIVEIEDPKGNLATDISEEDIRTIRRGIPGPAAEAVMNAINALSTDTKAGFESLAMETDFLSKR